MSSPAPKSKVPSAAIVLAIAMLWKGRGAHAGPIVATVGIVVVIVGFVALARASAGTRAKDRAR